VLPAFTGSTDSARQRRGTAQVEDRIAYSGSVCAGKKSQLRFA
jgi:hypothetical protein